MLHVGLGFVFRTEFVDLSLTESTAEELKLIKVQAHNQCRVHIDSNA